MKILVVKNRFNKKLNITKYLDWFKDKTPFTYTIEELKTDFDITAKTVGNGSFKGVVVGDDIFDKLRTVIPEGKYDIVVFTYGNPIEGIRTNYTPNKTLYPATDLIQLIKTDDGGKALNHEMFHVFFHRLERQGVQVEDPMDSVVYNGKVEKYFNNKSINAVPSNRSIALERLAPHWDKVFTMGVPSVPQKYKYFTNTEVAGLVPELCQKLDLAREYAGVPFILTSTLRDPEKNSAVGGVQNSAHINGEAADISCTDGAKRWKIINALLKAGFNRIGCAETFVHADVSKTLPQNVIWTYK